MLSCVPKRGLVKPLVQDGVVVTPVKVRNVPTTISSLTKGATTRNMPVQEIVIAVAPEEVAPLAEAMDLKYEITCVARSGRPASAPAPAARQPAGGASQGGMSQVLAALGKALLGKDVRPPRTRLAGRPEERKPSTQRRAKRPPRTGWQWTSRPD